MTALITVLVLTIVISAALRAAGFLRKTAVILATIPMAIFQLLALSAPMIIRTSGGTVIPWYAQLATGVLVAAASATIIATVVKPKEPIKSATAQRP